MESTPDQPVPKPMHENVTYIASVKGMPRTIRRGRSPFPGDVRTMRGGRPGTSPEAGE